MLFSFMRGGGHSVPLLLVICGLRELRKKKMRVVCFFFKAVLLVLLAPGGRPS